MAGRARMLGDSLFLPSYTEHLHAPSSVDSPFTGQRFGPRRRTAGNRLARTDAQVGPKGPRGHA
ncbi:hypothetical protein EMIT0347P_30170 [Pseudomonas sp. IT-347P]